MSRIGDLRPIRALTSPFWIIALAILLLNDHLFKGSGLLPGWLTGKLSDFAGVIVAAPLIAVLFRVNTRHAIALCHAAVGFGFAALELSPELTRAADSVYHVVGIAWKSTSDPTDLIALLILPLGHLLTVRASGSSTRHSMRVVERGAVLVGLLSCAASTGGKVDQQPACAGPDCDFDGYDAPEDCNDFDATIHPGAGCPNPNGEDICDDGIDNDADGLVDCEDPDCAFACGNIDAACAAGSAYHFDKTPVLKGSTLTGTSVTEGSCVGADSPEVIFQGDVPEAGTLTLGIPHGHGVHVRTECADAFTELACSIAVDGSIVVPITKPGNITIVVEALDPFQAGPFEVPVSFEAPGCGNGILDPGEVCDDGNNISGDGCDASCEPEYDVLCAELPILIAGSTTQTFDGGTNPFADSCNLGSIALPVRGFQYIPSSTTATVSVTSSDPLILYATTGCGDLAPSLGCQATVASQMTESFQIATNPAQMVTIFVAPLPNGPVDGSFTLDISEP